MAKQTNLYLTEAIKNGVAQLTNPGTTYVTVYTAGADDAIVKALMATSDDSADVVLTVAIEISSTTYVLGAVTVPAGAGTDGETPAVDLLNTTDLPGLSIDRNGKAHLPLQGAAVLKAVADAVTSGKTVNLVAIAEEY